MDWLDVMFMVLAVVSSLLFGAAAVFAARAARLMSQAAKDFREASRHVSHLIGDGK